MVDAVHRARERGFESLCDAELLSIVLGVKVSIAARMVEKHGGLGSLVTSDLAGIAHAERATLRVGASIELAHRAARSRISEDVRMPHAAAVAKWADWLTALEHEELWICALDAKNALRCARMVAMGGLSGLHVSVRDPIRVAIREAASAFVLVHNHPSGDPTPSSDDVSFTERVARAADIVGTPLLDHVVVGKNGFVSMLAAGLLPTRSENVPSLNV
jgi:DNA repair protein RadC